MLRQGGNAVDAAVAAAFTSFIAESALVNIGAGGIAQVIDPSRGQAVVYDFFSTMPGLGANGSGPATTLDFREKLVDFGPAQQAFYIGRGSAAVPGAVAGLCQMVAERGRLPLPTILAPAIRHAREGLIVSPEQAFIASIVRPILIDTPEIAAIYAPQGQFAQAGQRLYFTALADTLTRLAEEGSDLFYRGEIAQQIVQDQRKNGGLLTHTDLAHYQVLRCAPIQIAYRDYTILLPPYASDGGPLLAFTLELLSQHALGSQPHNSPEHLKLLSEAMRLTNVARAEWETYKMEAPSSNWLLQKATVQKYQTLLREILRRGQPLTEPPLPKGPANTTHLSVADDQGMVVSLTTSAGENAGFVVGDSGVMLNNMLGEMDLHPNGFHQLPAGQRLATMMSPTLVLHQGQPLLAVGSGGSNRLRSAILQTISNLIDFDLPFEAAVNGPRIHFEENVIQLEGGIEAEVADQLEDEGYALKRWPERNMFFGGAHAVLYLEKEKRWSAMGDARRGGSVVLG